MITESQIRAAMRMAQAGGRKTMELKDEGARGDGRFILRIRAYKGKAIAEWYAAFYRDGRHRLIKIGTYPTLGLAAARSKFKDDFAPVISAGGKPEGPRSRNRKTGPTIRDLFAAYVEHLEGTASEGYAKQARYSLMGKDGYGGLAKKIGLDKPAADVSPHDIIPHLASIYRRGAVVMAARTRTHVSAAFAYAIRSSNAYTRPAGSVDWGLNANPVQAIPADPESNRVGERHLSAEEFRNFWKWLETRRESSVTASALHVIMATGQRVTEILGISVQEYDRDQKIVDWSETKNGMPHAIPLPPQAVAALERMVPGPTGLFFPSPKNMRKPPTMNAVEKVVTAYIKHSGVPHFCPRDLRRTWKTLAGAAGLSKEIRDRIQNHARQDVSSRHYDRYEYMAEKRGAMAQWSAYMDCLLNRASTTAITIGGLRSPDPAMNHGALLLA